MPQVRVWEEMAVQRIDDLLESYMGIRDSDLGENKTSSPQLCCSPAHTQHSFVTSTSYGRRRSR